MDYVVCYLKWGKKREMVFIAMRNHPRYQHSLEELFLRVFILVDDWLKANQERFRLPVQANQVASYSELFTIALVGELLAQPYESVWYWLVRQNHRGLFPRLPEYSRYHRIVRNAEPLWAELAQSLAAKEDEDRGIELIDTKPLPSPRVSVGNGPRCPRPARASAPMGMVWGFKLHAVVSLGGLFRRWAFVPAHAHESRVAWGLVQGPTLGDRAYVGTGVYCPSRKNMKRQTFWPRALSRLRKRIETSFSSLVRSLHLHVGQVKTFWSLRARVNLKIAAHNLMHSGVLV
ncbi:IS982 family transposase [Calidithermus chliarophilus]|uniref:IS982 family transposase n=1 Tax=Calidithermus chliarophilus TaxID=52023 RepID=UPI001FE1A09D|nr:IS982 family transposase [Calidithermus chliarophilus]